MAAVGKADTLIEAILNGEEESAESLLQVFLTEYPIDAPVDEDGACLLHLAANSSQRIASLIVSAGANVNSRTLTDGYTPLHVAAMNGSIEGVKGLLVMGADPLLVDSECLTPADHALEEGHHDVLDLLNGALEDEVERGEVSVCETFVIMTMSVKQSDDLPCDIDTNEVPLQTSDNESPIANESHSLYTTALDINETFPFDVTDIKDAVIHDGTPNKSVTHQMSKLRLAEEEESEDESENDKEDGRSCSHKDTLELEKTSSTPSSLTNKELKEKLQSLGEQPGPITGLTRNAYINYLQKILDGVQPAGNKGYKSFKYELALCLNGTIGIPDLQKEEKTIFTEFRVANQSKTHFNYLLLDPLKLKSLSDESVSNISFKHFIESLFYVGKGKNSRSMQHLKDAKKLKMGTASSKMKRILNIWDNDEGVLLLHMFNCIASAEAFCREASMIDAIGIDNLTNEVRGHYHGKISEWSSSKRRLFGVYLLHKSFQSLQIDTPQPLYPSDL